MVGDLFKSLGIDKGEWLEDIERGDSSLASFLACVEDGISERKSKRFEAGLNISVVCSCTSNRSRTNCILHCVRRTRIGSACFGYAWSTTCSLRSYNHASIYSCLHINVFLSY